GGGRARLDSRRERRGQDDHAARGLGHRAPWRRHRSQRQARDAPRAGDDGEARRRARPRGPRDVRLAVGARQPAARRVGAARRARTCWRPAASCSAARRASCARTSPSAGATWGTDDSGRVQVFHSGVAVANFLQQVVSGLASGGIYGSLALALALIYRSTGVLNFAQGEMATFSTYVAWTLMDHGLGFWPAFVATLVIAFSAGVAIERTVIRPVE